ncbi:MAG: asparagine synthase C-terminal domain-containing protein [Halobacteriaceae archaeon]
MSVPGLDAGDPLPGTAGFAGAFDGTLARDVLGREPLFYDPDSREWARRPEGLQRFPAGHVHDGHLREAWTLPSPPAADPGEALPALREAVVETLADLGDLPVAFSGGVDSALVAAHADGPLYAVGFPDSHDLAAAREAAGELGRRRDLRVVELSLSAVEDAVPRVARAIDRTNAMDVAIALPLFLLAERVAADGFDRLALGQGADELFGGYAKVENAPDDDRVAADTVRGARDELLSGLPAQCERDVLALRAAGVEPVTPFLHDRVVRAALPLPGELLVADRRKAALRRVAREFLPAAVADREKKALQYGTLVARELDRLARRDGFKRRMDDHVSRYVAARR